MRLTGAIIATIITCSVGTVGVSATGCGDDESDADVTAEPAEEQPSAGELATRPSTFARDSLPRSLLHLYRNTGSELGVEWTILAAADQIEGAAGPTRERVPAIAYTLKAFSAAGDYRTALEARGGGAYATRVQRLAERYATIGDDEAPIAALPLSLPAEGTVIAGYGQRFGILHDGIDVDAPSGDPLRAAAAGLVVRVGTHPVFGLQTCLLHRLEVPTADGEQITTCYGNQSSAGVEPGDQVDAGEVIGRVGCTGTCLRPHVHFQVRLGSGPTAPTTDPARFLAAAAAREADAAGRPLESSQP